MQLNQVEYVQRVNFMVWEIMAAEEEQMFITGMLLLCDMNGYTMNHFTQMPLATVKKLMPCWEVCIIRAVNSYVTEASFLWAHLFYTHS